MRRVSKTSNEKEILRLYYPIGGYPLVVCENEQDGSLVLREETIFDDKMKEIIVSGEDAEYVKKFIDVLKCKIEQFILERFGTPNRIDWNAFRFSFDIDDRELSSYPKKSFGLNETLTIRMEPDNFGIPPFPYFECVIRGIETRIVEYFKKGNPREVAGCGWVVRFNVLEIRECILGFIRALEEYNKELRELGSEEDQEQEEE